MSTNCASLLTYTFRYTYETYQSTTARKHYLFHLHCICLFLTCPGFDFCVVISNWYFLYGMLDLRGESSISQWETTANFRSGVLIVLTKMTRNWFEVRVAGRRIGMKVDGQNLRPSASHRKILPLLEQTDEAQTRNYDMWEAIKLSHRQRNTRLCYIIN